MRWGIVARGKAVVRILYPGRKKTYLVSRCFPEAFHASRLTLHVNPFHAFAIEDLACSSVSCIEKYFSIPPSFSTRFT